LESIRGISLFQSWFFWEKKGGPASSPGNNRGKLYLRGRRKLERDGKENLTWARGTHTEKVAP